MGRVVGICLTIILVIPLTSVSAEYPAYLNMWGYKGRYNGSWRVDGDVYYLKLWGKGSGIGYPFILIWGQHPWYGEIVGISFNEFVRANYILDISYNLTISRFARYNVMTNIWLKDAYGNLYEIMVWHERSPIVRPMTFKCSRYYSITYFEGFPINLSDILSRAAEDWKMCGIDASRLRVVAIEFGIEVRYSFHLELAVYNITLKKMPHVSSPTPPTPPPTTRPRIKPIIRCGAGHIIGNSVELPIPY